MIVYVLAMVVFAAFGFAINFAWDRFVRRGRALALAQARRRARPAELPDPGGSLASLPGRLPELLTTSRATLDALDPIVDHFDLLLLRARARDQIGVVRVAVTRPRDEACALLQRWLATAERIYSPGSPDEASVTERLVRAGLGPDPIRAVFARERHRAGLEFRADSASVVEQSVRDLDGAAVQLHAIVRVLESGGEHPYR